MVLTVPDVPLEFSIQSRRTEVVQKAFLVDEPLARPSKKAIAGRHLTRCPRNIRLRAVLRRI